MRKKKRKKKNNKNNNNENALNLPQYRQSMFTKLYVHVSLLHAQLVALRGAK